jgi:hypothetical protein
VAKHEERKEEMGTELGRWLFVIFFFHSVLSPGISLRCEAKFPRGL